VEAITVNIGRQHQASNPADCYAPADFFVGGFFPLAPKETASLQFHSRVWHMTEQIPTSPAEFSHTMLPVENALQILSLRNLKY
jgi:hypothetical protein